MDHESTDTYSPTWFVSYYSEPWGLFTESGSAEARAQQSSLIVSQIPRATPISSDPHFHKPPYRQESDENMTMDVGNNFDTALSDFNVRVRIERSIIRDAQPPDEVVTVTTAERDLYTPSKSDWDETHKSEV
jgi:hypothetical protein